MMDKSFVDTLIDMLPVAYAYHRILCDETGKPQDYRFLRVNRAFEEFTGLKREDIIGRTFRETLPAELENGAFDWVKAYGEVALQGTKAEFNEYSKPLGKWFRILAYSPQKHDFITLFIDISDVIRGKEEAEAVQAVLNDAVFQLDSDYRFENFIVTNEEVIPLHRETIKGKTFADLFPVRIASKLTNALIRARQSGKRETVTYAIENSEGGKWYQAIVKYALIQRRYRYIVSISDISERKREEDALQKNEEIFRVIFDQAPIGIAIGSNDAYISHINPMFEKITGRTAAELKNISWLDITHPDDIAAEQDIFERLKAGDIDGYSLIKRYVRPDGSWAWINIQVVFINDGDAERGRRHICIVEDISDYIFTSEALLESERSKTMLLTHLPGIVFRRNPADIWRMEALSAGCLELTGYHCGELCQDGEHPYGGLIEPGHKKTLLDRWREALETGGAFKQEYTLRAKSGEIRWVVESGQGIYAENGVLQTVEGVITDITAIKQQEAKIHYVSHHDILTGLLNRQYYEKEKCRLNTYSCLPLSILIADIDGLRLINDAYGQEEGNHLLRETAKIFQSCSRKTDILARTGGDEFRLLMPNTDHEEAAKIAAAIQNACNRYNNSLTEDAYLLSLTIGLSTRWGMGEPLNSVEKTAEEDMCTKKLLNQKSSHNAIVSSIMATMFARSHETEEHAQRIALLSQTIGEKLGLAQGKLSELKLLAILHDIGKVGIDDRILKKPGKLNEEEWQIMKRHPEIGYRIAMSSPEFSPIAPYILCHHERWDGAGYPMGLSGDNIPLPSRILAVADAYDAMTEERIYKKAMSKEEAMNEIRINAGGQFDPQIAAIFLQYLGNQ